MSYLKTLRLRNHDRALVRVPREIVFAKPSPDKRTMAPRPGEPDLRPVPVIVRLRDLATTTVKRVIGHSTYDDCVEDVLEGPPTMTTWSKRNNTNRMLRYAIETVRLESGEYVPSNYPLQVDTETTTAGIVLSIAGRRGVALGALAYGAPHWVGPESVEDQRETIARLGASAHAERGNHGLDEWGDRLDLEDKRQWHPNLTNRVRHDGRAILKTAPQRAKLGLSSPWQYEPFEVGDEARYKCTEGDSWVSPPLAPHPVLRINRRRRLRVEILCAPQLQDVHYTWIAVYVLTVAWWFFVMYLPTHRLITLRAGQFPHVFGARGVSSAEIAVGVDMSKRLLKTQSYPAALLSDLDMSGFFLLVGRIQGRYSVRQRPLERGMLCAVVRYWYGRQIFPTEFRVFRRVQLDRPHDLLECDGFMDIPNVYPYATNVTATGTGSNFFPSTIDEGI